MKIFTNSRGLLSFFIDMCVVMFSWILAFFLRFNFDVPDYYILNIVKSLIAITIIQSFLFGVFKLFRGTWRYVSVVELRKIIICILLGTLILIFANFVLLSYFFIPRSVLIIFPLLCIFFMGGIRFLYRISCDYSSSANNLNNVQEVVIIGSGPVAVSLMKDLISLKVWRIVSILDDDSAMHGREIMGIEVKGGISLLPNIKEKYNLTHLIVAVPEISHKKLGLIIKKANELNLKTLTIPTIDDLITGKAEISRIRPINIEDLLGRDSVVLDNDGLDLLINKHTILITGAGGSIGSELCRQIYKFKPNLIICLDISESALYSIEQEFCSYKLNVPLKYIVGNIRNENFINKLLETYKPKIIFHAAAYKHVPMMEKENVSEAIYNNVFGTYILAKSAKRKKIDKFVLISTDKAVKPSNVMGASKRMAELVCQDLQQPNGTNFIVVRFGNVLGSSGSVIPKFKNQIYNGGPVTITHPDMTRYFMSIQEASQLVMQAGLIGKGGEILVLDMGEPIKIIDLALNMIKLSGFNDKDIAIKITGKRPGEKLFEEILLDFEKTIQTSHKKLRVAIAMKPKENYSVEVLKWIKELLKKDESLIKKELKFWVTEYSSHQ